MPRSKSEDLTLPNWYFPHLALISVLSISLCYCQDCLSFSEFLIVEHAISLKKKSWWKMVPCHNNIFKKLLNPHYFFVCVFLFLFVMIFVKIKKRGRGRFKDDQFTSPAAHVFTVNHKAILGWFSFLSMFSCLSYGIL